MRSLEGSKRSGMVEGLRKKASENLRKIEILFDTPGALQARRAGCYLEVYRVLYDLWAMGIRPSTILDIGANRGMFSKTAHYVFPGAEIYAFEPLQDCYQDLCKLRDKIAKFECYNVALADMAGESLIHRSVYSESSSLLPMDQLHKEAFPYTATVHLERIEKQIMDSILADRSIKRPVLMKLDVQGYENFVLNGAQQTLKLTDYILCELSFVPLYEGQVLFDDIYRQLISAGFRYSGQIAELRDPRSSRVLQADGLFERGG